MARLKRLVYDSVVVNLAEDEPLLGNEPPLLAMTDLLDGGGFDLKTGVGNDRARAAGGAPAGRRVAEVVTIGPPRMMEAVCALTREYGTPTVASLKDVFA